MSRLVCAACVGALLSSFGIGSIEGAEPLCAGPLGPAEVTHCALARSPEVRAEQQALQALSGRRITASTLLPAHPTVAINLARRQAREAGPEGQAPVLNWYVTLSQEIEIAGQRWARLEVADAALAAQVRRVAVAQQETVATALSAYYTLLAEREEQRLAEDLASVATSLSTLATARAQQALLSPVDARVAQAEATRLGLLRIEATRRLAVAQGILSTLLGSMSPKSVEVAGALEPDLRATPDPGDDAAALLQRAFTLRGELAAAEMERAMLSHQVSLLRRARIPNLTLSAVAQNDGFNELVLGGGLSFALPLPAPLGPSRRGEIAETVARGEQAESEIARVRRRVQQEVWQAIAAHRAHTEALALLPKPFIEQAQLDLRALAQAVGARQMPLREALLSQRSLIELLLSHIHTRKNLLLSRIELLRAVGLLAQSAELGGGR